VGGWCRLWCCAQQLEVGWDWGAELRWAVSVQAGCWLWTVMHVSLPLIQGVLRGVGGVEVLSICRVHPQPGFPSCLDSYQYPVDAAGLCLALCEPAHACSLLLCCCQEGGSCGGIPSLTAAASSGSRDRVSCRWLFGNAYLVCAFCAIVKVCTAHMHP
jgi:hypothetical protein